MRIFPLASSYAAAGLLIAATALSAQEPPPGVDVDRVTLAPGETKAFTLAPGNSHQLLVATANKSAKGVIVLAYQASAAGSVLTATSRTGSSMAFTILADPDGNGSFEPAGAVDNLPGDGSVVTTRWSTHMGKLNVGDFVGPAVPRPLTGR